MPPTTDSLAEAHRRNDEAWDAPRGYTKLRCTHCRFWFAAPDPSVTRCVDCELREARKRRQAQDALPD